MSRNGRGIATWLVFGFLAWLAARGHATHDAASRDLDVAEAVSRTAARAAAIVQPAVVSIRAHRNQDQEYGAGIMVGEEGLVLTALHVVAEATSVVVVTPDGREYPARADATDEAADLALVRLLAPGVRFAAARLGFDEEMRPGETVLVIGNPFGLGGSVTRGILSARGRRNVVPDNVVPLLQTDAAINPGSSGGAVVNLRGEVVGLVTAIMTRTGTDQGVGFAVPAAELRRALPFLVRGEPVQRAWIGVRVRAHPGVEGGLEVTSVVPGGPAAEAGVEAGDIVLRLRRTRIGDLEDMRREMRAARAGQDVEAGIRRGEELLTLRIRTALRRP